MIYLQKSILSRLRTTLTPVFEEAEFYLRDGLQFRNGPFDGHCNKVVNQQPCREALDRYLYHNLDPAQYSLINITAPKRSNLDNAGYFDIIFGTDDLLRDKLLAVISDVMIKVSLNTHNVSESDTRREHFAASVYLKKFYYNIKTRELPFESKPPQDYYTYNLSAFNNTQHIDLEKARHTVASIMIANGCNLPLCDIPMETDLEDELKLIAQGPEAIKLSLSDDWEVKKQQ